MTSYGPVVCPPGPEAPHWEGRHDMAEGRPLASVYHSDFHTSGGWAGAVNQRVCGGV
jgi:hypothetical protein